MNRPDWVGKALSGKLITRASLVNLDRQRPHQPQTALGVGKGAHYLGTSFQFLVQPFEHVGRLHVLMMLQGQPIVG